MIISIEQVIIKYVCLFIFELVTHSFMMQSYLRNEQIQVLTFVEDIYSTKIIFKCTMVYKIIADIKYYYNLYFYVIIMLYKKYFFSQFQHTHLSLKDGRIAHFKFKYILIKDIFKDIIAFKH